ncbi:MAG: hypothetical protein JSU96_21240 [Acidobacteriota bacterium]|nr:MAG: hypothetical protein JSU96_21240 [Acidobacteriota bacterium]
MTTKEKLGNAGRSYARGVVSEKMSGIDKSTENFKGEAASMIESVADQIKDLGRQFDRGAEAAGVARRLEKTADYIRYRPTAEVAGDTWEVVKKYRLLWITGGLLGGIIIARLAQRRLKDSVERVEYPPPL